jgi:hypothetical protein
VDDDGGRDTGHTMGEEATGPILGSLLELSVFEGPKFELTVIQSLICVSSPLEIAYAPTTNPILFTIQSTPSIRKIKKYKFFGGIRKYGSVVSTTQLSCKRILSSLT